MTVKRFDELFPAGASIEPERRRFVNRVNADLFSVFASSDPYQYSKFVKETCLILGENPDDLRSGFSSSHRSLAALTKGDFFSTLRVLCAVYETFGDKKSFSRMVKKILEYSGNHLGVRWKDGVFYPAGDELLDKELVGYSFDFLARFPAEKKDLLNALKSHSEKNLKDVVTNCYTAVEGVVRILLRNTKTLDNNKDELLLAIGLSNHWAKIVANFINYSHEARHAALHRHDLSPNEVEAYLYQTCLLLRLLNSVELKDQKANTKN